MKTPFLRKPVAIGQLMLFCAACSLQAVTFTSNTLIGLADTNYDGLDIVVTNCTLTVDGPHAFASLLVANGGTLTHTWQSSGFFQTNFNASQSMALSGTSPVTLVPANPDAVIVSFTVTDAGQTISYTNGVDYVTNSSPGVWLSLQRTANSAIPDGSTVLVSYNAQANILQAGLSLTIAGNVTVAAGGSISAIGIGYDGGQGPGAGAGNTLGGGGGGYGGNGGMSSSGYAGGLGYGSFTQPVDLGSGGGFSYAGSGGAGGGAIKLSVSGAVTVNGVISANGASGTNSRSGGGSGGSIWISAQSVVGSGKISANGGSAEPSRGGGGGGGRISIQCNSDSFSGSMTAFGGTGAVIGGAGTIYTQLTNQNGSVVLDNGGMPCAASSLSVTNGADVVARSKAVVSQLGAWTAGNVTIASSSMLVVPPQTTLVISANTITVQAGASLSADSAGYPAGLGSGAGAYGGADPIHGPCSGGAYGGSGAYGSTNVLNKSTLLSYGSQGFPASMGSGGGSFLPTSMGGAGGGAIQLNVTGVLQIDGSLSANGGNGSGGGGGGGSGGSIWLNALRIAGSGSISANGGSGASSYGGGGGGGRIAVYSGADQFLGMITAVGGGGANWAGAGTLFVETTGQVAQLIVDNAGHFNTNGTPVQYAGSAALTVRNGAFASLGSPGQFDFASLTISSNAWVGTTASPIRTTVSISGDAIIHAGGGIQLDGSGYGPGQGLGTGRIFGSNPYSFCGGAGHGGYGGNSSQSNTLGGIVYDTAVSPMIPGSGGGSSVVNNYSTGGWGGGAMALSVQGTLDLDGLITANGGNASSPNGGGGSGGSLNISAGVLSGTGTISANGGFGADGTGGGGGGGMIAIHCSQDLFTGSLSAYGGGGANWGGAGTTYLVTNGLQSQIGQVVLDNGGHLGTNTSLTPFQFNAQTDLRIRNGAAAVVPTQGQLSLHNLLIESNGSFVLASIAQPASLNLSLMGDLSILAGGRITADSAGYLAGQGPGLGRYSPANPQYPCSGGGHGGYGGRSSDGYAAGGTPNDTAINPGIPGSGGGMFAVYSYGGAGGGLIQLNVTGNSRVDGSISANGGNGFGTGGGGGSGGSFRLTTTTLSGSGSINANGGRGAGNIGGGGSGGRISVAYMTNAFTGNISAFGGGGANWGGAGTIYLAQSKLGGASSAQLILDNGGNSGTNSQFLDAGAFDVVVRGNAALTWPPSTVNGSVQIGSNSVVNVPTGNMIVFGDLTVAGGGAITADGTGYSPSSTSANPGTGGRSASGYAGGGGHGGFGAVNPPSYGGVYDSVQIPSQAGGAGANGSGSSFSAPFGGAGGGVLNILVRGKTFPYSGTLTLNGRISANGNDGDINSGGGAGGSVVIQAATMTGSGLLSANGGFGYGIGGGGGGGRIAIKSDTNNFTGSISAYGGGGVAAGGAGTIYFTNYSHSYTGGYAGQIVVDNGGLAGTNTPVDAFGVFDLTIRNGAVVNPSGDGLVLSNLIVDNGGLLTSLAGQTNLNVALLGNALIASNGAVAVDGAGFAQGLGPGAGLFAGGFGSGAGYGGQGGPSPAAAGGLIYGSATQPVDQGSGGGFGSGPLSGGSEGGGAVRLTVGGTLTVNGWLTANGFDGLQDNAGGGSGGSLWVTAGALAGNGYITADGGIGDFLGGGGGSGGRIAYYRHTAAHRTNNFTATFSATGGPGYSWADDGTVFLGSDQTSLQILSNTPSGDVVDSVSYVDLTFNAAVNPATVLGTNSSVNNVTVLTPDAQVVAGSSVSILSPLRVRVSLPQLTTLGTYTLSVGQQVQDVFGQPMPQAYIGTFSIRLPQITGKVTDLNGRPIPGVDLQVNDPLSDNLTDAAGGYAIGFNPGTEFTVTPSGDGLTYIPSSRTYSDLALSDVANENYFGVTNVAPVMKATMQSGGLTVSWFGIPGVTYQLYSSTNLVDWEPYNAPVLGANGTVSFSIPVGVSGKQFFRATSSY